MFDIGFWEILLIGVVTLLVVGPQRLPGLAVFAGHWIGRLRRFARNMRDEINEELETEHLKTLVAEQNREIDELRRDVQAVRGDTERSLREAEDEVREAQSAAREAGDEAREATATGSNAAAPDAAEGGPADSDTDTDTDTGTDRGDGTR